MPTEEKNKAAEGLIILSKQLEEAVKSGMKEVASGMVEAIATKFDGMFGGERAAQIEEMQKDFQTKLDEIKKQLEHFQDQPAPRKSAYEVADIKRAIMDPFGGEELKKSKSYKTYYKVVTMDKDDPGYNDEVKAFQILNDDLLILNHMVRNRGNDGKRFRWEKFDKMKSFYGYGSELRKAMDTATSGEGADWIPTNFSAELIRVLHLAQKVAALHPTFRMPTDTFRWPLQTSNLVAYLVSEATSDSNALIKASTPGTSRRTFDAVKLGARVLSSTELDEDSATPLLPFLKDEIVQCIIRGIENAIINGDNAATHMDSDVTTTDDQKKAWEGYRKLCLDAAKVDCGTFSQTTARTIREKMGKYGINPFDLAWVPGIKVYIKMLAFDDVRTVDKYGSKATVLQGELGKFDGIPIVVSEHVKEDLNASGLYDGTTTTKTILPLIHVGSFLLGDRRIITVKSDEKIETDQFVIVTTWRGDFKARYNPATEAIIGIGRNITS